MLHDLIASTAGGETILDWIELAAMAIELIAVAIIAGAIVYAISHYLFQSILRPDKGGQYQQLKVRLGKALLLGLETWWQPISSARWHWKPLSRA